MRRPRSRASVARVAWILLTLIAAPAFASAKQSPHGHLLLIGGGLRSDNAIVYEKLIALAGGREHAVIGIIPAAGLEPVSSLAENLVRRGLPRDRVFVIDIRLSNASQRAHDPGVVARILGCSAIYFSGGDQRRAAIALLGPDGGGTPALDAIRDVYRRGGVVAGSSAGAAVQGTLMISAHGQPIDTLDFGLAAAPRDLGVLVSRGLGFFGWGFVDQHFNAFHGRLARVARAQIERQVPLGFGIDENTALVVSPDNVAMVLGTGGVTVVDTSHAALTEGPDGPSLSTVVLHYLEQGDVIDLGSGACRIGSRKPRIEPGRETNAVNQVVADLAQTNALKRAIIDGLVDNVAATQDALLVRFNGDYGHGYRFTFSKTEATRGYAGLIDGDATYAATDVRLDIRPVDLALGESASGVPSDLRSAPREVRAIVHWGVLAPDPGGLFHPARSVTRAEFAVAVARLTAVVYDGRPIPVVTDVRPVTLGMAEVRVVVANGLMDLGQGRFRPDSNVTQYEVADTLARAGALRGACTKVDLPALANARAAGHVEFQELSTTRAATRAEVALALFRFLRSPVPSLKD